jgi:hypothetical protein
MAWNVCCAQETDDCRRIAPRAFHVSLRMDADLVEDFGEAGARVGGFGCLRGG